MRELGRRTVLKAGGLGAVLPGVSRVATGTSTRPAEGTTVYIGSLDGHLYALDAAGGDEQWRLDLGAEVRRGPTVVNGTVYVGAENGLLYAVTADSGEVAWQFDAGGSVTSNATVVDGTVYVGSGNGLYAVDAAKGRKRWRYGTSASVPSAPNVVDGTVYVGSGRNNGVDVHAVSAEHGSERWTFSGGTDEGVYASPTVLDGTVYASAMDGLLYALDADTGDERWHFQTAGNLSSSPTVVDGHVYVGGWDNRVYDIDVDSGTEAWSVDVGSRVYSSPTVAIGTVYVGTQEPNGAMYALDAGSGDQLWTFETGEAITSSPTVHAEGVVFFGATDSRVYAFDAGSGDELWRTGTGDAVLGSATVVDDPASGHSVGSRVELGTIGHHHVWAGTDPGGTPEEPALELELLARDVRAGGTVDIVFRLSNVGNARASGLQGFISPPGDAWEVVGDPGAFDTLAPGETATATVTYRVPTGASGVYEFAGVVEDDAGHTARGRVTVEVTSLAAGLEVDLSKVAAGEFSEVVVTVTSDTGEIPDPLDLYVAGTADGATSPLAVDDAGDRIDTFGRSAVEDGVRLEASLLVAEDASNGDYPLQFELKAGDATLGETTATLVVNNAPHVVADIDGTYAGMLDRGLEPGWWRTRATDAAQDALRTLAPSFDDVAIEALTSAIEAFAHASAGGLASNLVTILDQLVSIITALDLAATANVMGAPGLSEIQQYLRTLEDNTTSLGETTAVETRDDLFFDRRFAVEQLYDELPSYLRSVHTLARNPGTAFDDYLAVRRIVEQLRLVLVADYAATRSWLEGEPTNLALAVGRPLGYQTLNGETYSMAVDSMDFGSDYGLVELEVPPAFDGYDLIVEVDAPPRNFDDGLTATLFANEPDPRTPTGGDDLRRQGDRRVRLKWTDVSAGEYYLLVRAGGTVGPYEVDTMLRKGMTAWRSYAPQLRVVQTGWRDRPPIEASRDESAVEATDPGGDATTDTEGESASDDTGTAEVPPSYAQAPEIEDGDHRLSATAREPARLATELSAGERLSVNVPADAAEAVSIYVDAIEDHGLETVASAERTGRVTFTAQRDGTYYVGVHTSEEDGIETRLSVRRAPATNELPRALPEGPTEPRARAEVTLDGSGSLDPDGTIETYEWDLDDDGSFEATGETVTHRFPTAGDATVRLRVTDDDGGTDVTAVTVDVRPSDVTATSTDADGGLPGWLGVGGIAGGATLYRWISGSDGDGGRGETDGDRSSGTGESPADPTRNRRT